MSTDNPPGSYRLGDNVYTLQKPYNPDSYWKAEGIVMVVLIVLVFVSFPIAMLTYGCFKKKARERKGKDSAEESSGDIERGRVVAIRDEAAENEVYG